jgi:hypothetical protein
MPRGIQMERLKGTEILNVTKGELVTIRMADGTFIENITIEEVCYNAFEYVINEEKHYAEFYDIEYIERINQK